uniref:Uncharacterized protein n=1 Tax=Alexandrium andersonii TaxID=327968 RepID=A0A7S2CUD0_9DINO
MAPTTKQFFREFRLACLDYAKVALGHHLAGYDPARLRKGRHNLKRPGHNRSVSHLLGFIRFLDRLLDGEEVPGFGPSAVPPLATPIVIIDGASGPDASVVNGAYELRGFFSGKDGEPPPVFAKLDCNETVWLYLAHNDTWCVSSLNNKEASATVCWAYSEPLSPGAVQLPPASASWWVTVEDNWQKQDLRILPRVLVQSKEGKQRSDAER